MSEFLGVAFSPYVGYWTGTAPNAKVPLWNSYSEQDIVQMLDVIAPQFNKISTYGMGYSGYYPLTTPWNQLDSNCLVASAAAQLNRQTGRVAIEVAQGIYQQVNPAHLQAEIEAAFSAASSANAVYPNTVTSLIDKWAFEHRVMTYLFEAFDEPWKSNPNANVPPDNSWQRPNGAEGHYGLWYLNKPGKYTHKNV